MVRRHTAFVPPQDLNSRPHHLGHESPRAEPEVGLTRRRAAGERYDELSTRVNRVPCGGDVATFTVSVATSRPFRSTNSNTSLYGAFGRSRGFVTIPRTSRPVSVESNWLTATSPTSSESPSL